MTEGPGPLLPMPNFKALIFDLDGVLIDSERVHWRTWREAFGKFGLEFPQRDERLLQGLRGEQVLDLLRSRLGVEIEAVDMAALLREKREAFVRRLPDEVAAVPGADAFLRAHKGKLPLALVTSARLETVGKVMQAFNWRNVFDALIGAQHVTRPKPHPEGFEKAAARFRLAPADCLVFEDSEIGIQAACAAGSAVCGVATTLKAAELRKAGARWAIQDFQASAELDRALQGIDGAGRRGWLKRLWG